MVTPSRARRRTEAQRGRAGLADRTMAGRRRAAETRTRRMTKGGGSGRGPGGSRSAKPATAATAGPAVRRSPRWASPRPDVIPSPTRRPRPRPAAELRPGAVLPEQGAGTRGGLSAV